MSVHRLQNTAHRRGTPQGGPLSLYATDAVSLGDSAVAAMPGSFAWVIDDGATLYPVAGTSTLLATGVAVGATAYASPDPLPGQTLEIAGANLNLVSDSTVPNAYSDRRIQIEVLDTVQAVAQIMRTGELFGAGQAGANAHIQYAMDRMQDGDTLQISPGAIWLNYADGSQYLEAGMFHIWKTCTIQNIPGRGRWRFAPKGMPDVLNYTGICVREQAQTYPGVDNSGGLGVNGRKTIVIEGFEGDNWGPYGGDKGIRIRANRGDSSPLLTMADWHASITIRDFKMGKASTTAGSGISGASQVLVIEDGDLYDIGDGGEGNEHNLYITAETMTLRGLRLHRTRGWVGTPYASGVTLEGHIAKLDALTGTIEGCSFDNAPSSDHSLLVQMKGGGNWTIRGNLFIDSSGPNVGSGAINMCRESPNGNPNFAPWAGSTGNSILFEKNVYIGHYPRPIIFFFDPATLPLDSLYPSGDTSVVAARRLNSLTVRDNIAMVQATTPYYPPIAGFPGANDSMWIWRDPNAGTYWTARGNTKLTYDVNEAAFAERLLKKYTRIAGTIAANAGTVATKRFVWPHGYVARSDAYQGLG